MAFSCLSLDPVLNALTKAVFFSELWKKENGYWEMLLLFLQILKDHEAKGPPSDAPTEFSYSVG